MEIQSTSNTKRILNIFAGFLLVCLVGFIIAGIALTKVSSNSGDGWQLINDGWTDSNGEYVVLNSLQGENGETQIYYMLGDCGSGKELVFASRNTYVDVYENGQIVNKDQEINSKIFGTSSGTKWHIVTLNPEDSAIIEMRCRSAYDDSDMYISNVYVGDAEAVIHHLNTSFLAPYTMNAVWIFFSMLLIVIYVLFKHYFNFQKDLLYLALGSLSCSTWCGAESRSWQLIVGRPELDHLISYISLLCIPIIFSFLFTYKLEGKWQLAARIYQAIAVVSVLGISFLHFTGILEFHYTLSWIHVLIAFLLPLASKVIVDYSRIESMQHLKKLLFVGYSILVVLMVIGMVRYIRGNYNDYAIFFDGALFCLMGILFIYQMAGINEVVRKGLQMEFLKDLAMMDHLTKLFNRTGFADRRPEYEATDKPIGVVQFDVNNLKTVNDTQGHEKGDELICLAASGIAESFGKYGQCYRMGGDEFLAIMDCEDLKESFATAISTLKQYCNAANSFEGRTFDLNIAYGFAIKQPGDNLSEVMERADGLMYAKKKEMKTKQ